MDREFKIALGLLVGLLGVGVFLLEALADIHFYSRDFAVGFFPFALLLAPYILFSTRHGIESLRRWTEGSLSRKLLLPLYILLTYSIFSRLSGSFQWETAVRLAFWLYIPALLLSADLLKGGRFYIKEMAAALLLWLPIEYGQLPGFDIVFRSDIQIPALAFAAPVFGLYLFSILEDLPDIGYRFQWKWGDLAKVAGALVVLALILIPVGTQVGFIRYSTLDLSVPKAMELLFGIYFLVAVPEELLFRGIIQNILTKVLADVRFGRALALLLAASIFGFSHYNNFNPPDWRYVYLATVAGAVYGFVYMKTGRTTVSALVHCGVNFLWAVMFKDTSG